MVLRASYRLLVSDPESVLYPACFIISMPWLARFRPSFRPRTLKRRLLQNLNGVWSRSCHYCHKHGQPGVGFMQRVQFRRGFARITVQLIRPRWVDSPNHQYQRARRIAGVVPEATTAAAGHRLVQQFIQRGDGKRYSIVASSQIATGAAGSTRNAKLSSVSPSTWRLIKGIHRDGWRSASTAGKRQPDSATWRWNI